MNIEHLFWQLISGRGQEWLEASLALQAAGYAWEWTFHRDGSEEFALKYKEEEDLTTCS